MARVVAAKCTLAARVDSFHESPEGKVGQGIYLLLNSSTYKVSCDFSFMLVYFNNRFKGSSSEKN